MKTSPTLFVLVALVLATLSRAVTHHVYNATDFNALPSLNSGDIVILHDGNYGALNKTLTSTIADDATAQSDPVFVIAENAGGANITAPSQITLAGRGIVLAGLDFTSTSGMLDNGGTSPAWIIRTASNSRYMTLSNLRFFNADAGDDYGHWVYIEGFNHTIEYSSFEGKLSANATVAFKRNTAEAGITTPRNHAVRFCWFGPRICSTTENGFETIRIGDSASQAHDMSVTIERNVFYRAIWRNDGQFANDLEIISNKSRGNKILHNTFLESYGQITLRHGDACIVEGNFIFGAGYYDTNGAIALRSANTGQGGIRIIGQDHIVRNNYLVNLAGTNLRAALCLMAGASTWTDGNGSGGNNGYETANNAEIYHNTFLDCRELNLGFVNGSSNVQPTGVKIYNNAWQGSGTSNGVVRNSAFTPAGSGGNYLYHPSGSTGWSGLGGTYSSTVSPAITDTFEGYRIPTSTSPLLNAANSTLSAAFDLRNLERPATSRDIGAFERQVSGSDARPLLRNQVGAGFDGGPAGTYPDPGAIDTTPVITTASLPAGTVNSAYTQSFGAIGGENPLKWSVIAGSLPVGLSLSEIGVLSGTPTAFGTSNFTVKVEDLDLDLDTQAFALVINPAGSVATPTFSPAGGTYSSAQSVAIASATSGATIRYTTNGSTPTATSGTIYTGPVNVASSLTLRAIAYRAGFTDSAVASATYTIGSSPTEIIPTAATDSTPWDTAGLNGPENLWDGATADGGNDSRWASNASPGTLASAPRYVVLDLGASYQLTQFVVHSYASRAYHHEIHVSADGTNWGSALVDVQPTTGATSYTHNVNGTGRYVRLRVDGISGTTTTWASINELDIFGTPAGGGGGGGTGAFIMSSNAVSMEAENANTRTAGGGKNWTDVTESSASGGTSNNAIQALANSGTTASAPGTGTCRADFQISVPAGAASTFYVHLRSRGPSGSDDSVYLSLNGSTSTFQTFTATSTLAWKTANNTITLPAGTTTTLTVWMREDGTIVDKIVVSSSSTLPTGTGPAESSRL